MKSIEEFNKFCKTQLSENLNLMSSLRSSVVKKILILRAIFTLMILGILGIMFISEMFIDELENNIVYLIVAIILLIIYIIILSYIFLKQRKIKSEFVHKFKHSIINSIVKFFDESFSYDPYKSISFEEFKSSGLIAHKLDKYYGDDLVTGKIGETQITFSEVHAFYEETRDNKKNYVEVFGGIFFIGDFNKNFKGKTYILPDKIEKTMGRFAKFFQSLIKTYGELVKLEDLEFEKEFAVYSNDQIEARYILSTSLMKRILDFRKKAGTNLSIGFKASKIYIAIELKGNLFEPKIFGKLIAEDTLNKYYSDLELALSIVEELNLNLRIWGKN